MNDPRLIIVSLLTGTIVSRCTWADWTVDNGECLSLADVTDIADALRLSGEFRLDDHLIVNADFVSPSA